MPIELTASALRQIWPKAPDGVIHAFIDKQSVLDAAGITHTRVRLSVAFSQIEHETAGFTIKDLTENINYSAAGAARVWPSRFKDADAVRAKYGTGAGWQLNLIDDVYGSRMGNRPGTHDGSSFVGRGGPQVTGRDGYREVGKRARLPLEDKPVLACAHEYQPEILAAFWTWKNLNPVVDVGGLKAATKPWNGGYIGMADREARMKGNDPIVARMAVVERIAPIAKGMPGTPPTPAPTKEAIDAATVKERRTATAGAGAGGTGAVSKGAKATTEQPADVLIPAWAEWTLIGAGVAVIVVAALLIARKRAAIKSNWF
jgi:putative chitinase